LGEEDEDEDEEMNTSAAIVPLAAPKREYDDLAVELEEAILRTSRSGWYVLGNEHDAFEVEFAKYLGVSHVLGVANGTDALEIALRAVGCGRGDEVMVTANSGGYASIAARCVGAVPRFADVDPVALSLDLDEVRRKVVPATRAIVVTHLYGAVNPSIEDLAAFARDSGVALIEDCAQAHGARVGTRLAGTFGDIATFSFYPTKNLGALGDGGAISTSSDSLADRVRKLRQYGWSDRYVSVLPGGRNSRLDEVQAAVLRVKLTHLDRFNLMRRRVVNAYGEAAPSLRPIGVGDSGFAAHLAVVRPSNRERFTAAAREVGIATGIHFPLPDYRQPAFGEGASNSLAVTELASMQVTSLPCHPFLSADEVDRVVKFLQSQEATVDIDVAAVYKSQNDYNAHGR
jgi:dTDP-3-amino-2,3,6-trideoxy-4-keto-D-glucose/dTDP-3-amino-3,4,6-trideoxy-alpha-D-glucose/dTDP-2,6-dideoxy-D-kanosamine transaminase